MPNQRSAMFGINGKLSKLSMGKTVRVIGRGRMLPIANKKRALEDSNEGVLSTMSPESVKAEETLREEAPLKKQLAEPSKKQEESVLEVEVGRMVEAESEGSHAEMPEPHLDEEQNLEGAQKGLLANGELFSAEGGLVSAETADGNAEQFGLHKGKRRGKKHRKNR